MRASIEFALSLLFRWVAKDGSKIFQAAVVVTLRRASILRRLAAILRDNGLGQIVTMRGKLLYLREERGSV